MSYTVSRGLVDASHWTGMASSVGGYLARWSNMNEQYEPFPRGQFVAARRFFNHVLEGSTPARKEKTARNVPTAAGISNLAIAVEVLAALPSDVTSDENVQQTVRSYLECLQAIQNKQPRETINNKVVSSLISFLRRLQLRGNLARIDALPDKEYHRV